MKFRLIFALATILITISAAAVFASNPDTNIKVSTSSNRSNAVVLEGVTLKGNVYISYVGAARSVSFYLDGNKTPFFTDYSAPFDLAGTESVGTAKPFNTNAYSNGIHSIALVVKTGKRTYETHNATFAINSTIVVPPVTSTSPTSSTSTTTQMSMPPGSTMPPVSSNTYPLGNPGASGPLVISGAPTGAPSATGISAFRTECGYSHMKTDDPIVFPNQAGMAHLHTFFGNTSTNANSTYSSLRSSGNGTCSGGTLNRSAYWVPSILSNSKPIAPSKSVMYYKSGYPSVSPTSLSYIPNGLKMITGTATSSSPQNSGFTFIEWYCQSTNSAQYTIPSCAQGDELILAISFPQCWDGVNLDSANHKSHMSFPQSYSGAGCPSTHPVAIPQITMLVHWPVPAGGTSSWRLSSDMYDPSIPGGYSAHADFFEGWDPTTRNTFTDKCLKVGKDCQVRWLGDGRSLVNVPGVS